MVKFWYGCGVRVIVQVWNIHDTEEPVYKTSLSGRITVCECLTGYVNEDMEDEEGDMEDEEEDNMEDEEEDDMEEEEGDMEDEEEDDMEEEEGDEDME